MILFAATLLMRRRLAKFLTGWQEKTRLTRQHPRLGRADHRHPAGVPRFSGAISQGAAAAAYAGLDPRQFENSFNQTFTANGASR
ncbi:MAG TPA: hypothetical protein PLF25_04770 [Accumulibacter sp.]|jgi:hypothetical protein|nr:hypothetical protein [Accumulibacter sp.]